MVKNPPAMLKTWAGSLGCEDPLENGKATHSSILENSMDCIVHGVTKSWTWVSDSHFHVLMNYFSLFFPWVSLLSSGFNFPFVEGIICESKCLKMSLFCMYSTVIYSSYCAYSSIFPVIFSWHLPLFSGDLGCFL